MIAKAYLWIRVWDQGAPLRGCVGWQVYLFKQMNETKPKVAASLKQGEQCKYTPNIFERINLVFWKRESYFSAAKNAIKVC